MARHRFGPAIRIRDGDRGLQRVAFGVGSSPREGKRAGAWSTRSVARERAAVPRREIAASGLATRHPPRSTRSKTYAAPIMIGRSPVLTTTYSSSSPAVKTGFGSSSRPATVRLRGSGMRSQSRRSTAPRQPPVRGSSVRDPTARALASPSLTCSSWRSHATISGFAWRGRRPRKLDGHPRQRLGYNRWK